MVAPLPIILDVADPDTDAVVKDDDNAAAPVDDIEDVEAAMLVPPILCPAVAAAAKLL